MEVFSIESILFIAPNKDVAVAAKRIIAEIGLNCPLEVSNVEQAQDIAKKFFDINVIISRGKVAEVLSRLPGKTVVEITITIDDILAPIKRMAATGLKKIGVVANISLIDDIGQDLRLADFEIFIRPWHNENELRQLIAQLQGLGVEGIVGDIAGSKIAKECGFGVEFLNSGAVSIKGAIKEAMKIAKAQEYERLREDERTQQIKQCITEMYTAIEQAAAAVEQLTASSQEVAATSHETANIAKIANQKVKNTTDILDIIRRVAQQTNLLGLNAAIEAARVGEYGRGFSVVADEVRKLAVESQRSASDINSMLGGFRNAVEQVLKNVEQSHAITQEQAKATQEIASMLDGLQGIGNKLMSMTKNG